ncbi:High affinity cAMP-specific 3',5'-cyclic phosphodiesterase 7A [Echinococcus granulosus]|uniref:High affinity cAMP specific 3'5' cyclic n=1 Tax=Echinococcus granulosus TaxID=6210 RepID=A0A068WL13_ECHGR|nr:High affinity cAMP-specific 3',5'-cyclic phosphodiesterase 7A [Echinococcus granulosus]CDS18359.1 high affinity cAMP specific 3'5' cyclic [Echinococcus granulosus]
MPDRSKSKADEFKDKRRPRYFRCLLDETYFVDRQSLLQPLLHWNFNLFTLERLTAGFPLLAIGKYLFEKSKFFQKFHLDHFLVVRLLRQIEDLYHENNPYHNALHAADVTQATYCLLKRLRVEKSISAFDFMCAILAAICHDIDHPGVNQAFLIKTKQMLSIFYEESILEHHHSNVCISVLLQSRVFSAFSIRRWGAMKHYMKRLILATDISKQEEYLEQLESLTERRYPSENYLPTHEDITLVMEMAIKCADISNPCRHWETCQQWANCITEEFFQQGDRESLLGLPVMPLMDRNKTTKAKVQIGFIEFQVLPLFEQWDAYVRSKFSRSLVAKCKKNLAIWLARDAAANEEQRTNLPL